MPATENREQFASAEMLAGARATFINGLIEVAAEIERFCAEENRQGERVSARRAIEPQRSAFSWEKGAALAVVASFGLGCLAPIMMKTICLGFGATLKLLVFSAGVAPVLLAR